MWGAELPAVPWPSRPYRALVVVEHWSDHASVLVDSEKDEFQPVAALLKACSVPLDIIRLEQQDLDDSYLFDREKRIRFKVVIWLADSASYRDQNLGALGEAARGGTSLPAVNSPFLDPVLKRLLGGGTSSPFCLCDGSAPTTGGRGLLLRKAETWTGIIAKFAACFRDHRKAVRIEHEVDELVAKRVYGWTKQ
jgi:hypothetical protein